MFAIIKQTNFNNCKSGIQHSVEFHFKSSNRKPDQKCPKLLHKKPKLQTCLNKKAGKLLDMRQKARQIK